MPSLRNQTFNNAQKARADKKILTWLPFGEPGWNVVDISKQTGLTWERARSSLARLIQRGAVVREWRNTGNIISTGPDGGEPIRRAREYRYWRPSRKGLAAIAPVVPANAQREKRSRIARPR